MATLKNTKIQDTGYIQVPTGSISERPSSPESGYMRFNTDNSEFEMYDGTNWVIISKQNYYQVTTDGLLIHLDADNTDSYNGSGNTWYDLQNSNNVTINGGATTATLGGTTAFNLNSSGKYFTGTLSGTMPSTNATLEAWIYPASSELTSGDRGTIIKLTGGQAIYMSWNKSNQYLSNYWYAHSPDGYHESNGPSARSEWHHWCAVWNYSDGNLYQWVDGNKTSVTTSGNASTGTDLNIGRESSTRQFSGGIAIIRIYNKALTDDEVLGNFNSEKDRFGL